MTIPATVLNPPFNITRISHVVLTVNDLNVSREFYADLLGFVVSAQEDDVLYLRGLEEQSHHSLVLKESASTPVCERVGLRVLTDEDLDKAAAYFAETGYETNWVDVPHQGRTLHVDDAIGTPLELCATMDVVRMHHQDFYLFRGSAPHRLDHAQVAAYDVQAATDFYMALGFRLSEYTARDGTEELWGTWLQRKGNPHDVVFTNGKGPCLHHFAYTVADKNRIIDICDIVGSANIGITIERGPGRHGIGNALFVYFRDPDGHRIELFDSHYQMIDLNFEPLRWDLTNTRRSQIWGLPATASWFYECSPFAGKTAQEPLLKAKPVTLKAFLENQY